MASANPKVRRTEAAVLGYPDQKCGSIAHVAANLTGWQKRVAGTISSGYIRLRDTDPVARQENQHGCFKLPVKAWPRRFGRPAWPSSPTFNEWTASRGRILYTTDLHAHVSYTPVSMKQFNSQAKLARRIVDSNVIGVRDDIRVPDKYLGFFRRRWGFLILTSPGIVPIGLARFLASIWITDFRSLWLQRPVPLKKFLRAVPTDQVKLGATSDSEESISSEEQGSAGPPSEADEALSVSEFSDSAEFDQYFADRDLDNSANDTG